jgi:hypothetical protein
MRCLLKLLIVGFFPASGLPGKDIDFNRDIRPILSDRCFQCHGPDKEHRKGKLRLDDEASAKDLKKGVIVPGKPDESELVYRITTEDEDDVMPPPDIRKPLSEIEKKLLARWIASGAEWAPHWAYVHPRLHDRPKVQTKGWVTNWIDAFTLGAFEDRGVKPVQDAAPVTLIRRLHFDVTGLPPVPETVEGYAQSPSLKAYERIVDNLLGSGHFGERMASYWLDLVRFADTVGYHGDQDHSITPYRDWIIDAFNDDLPFDQFTREQLAGDLLTKPSTDQIIATGYNRLLQTSHEGGVQAKEYIAMYAADRVRNVSAVWMGATVGCAQCHDHKYDPYTSRDFYTLSAFFADIDDTAHLKNGTNSLPTRREPEMTVHNRRERQLLTELQKTIENRVAAHALSHDPNLAKEIQSLKKDQANLKKLARKTMITRATKPRVTRVLPRGDWLDESGPIVEPAIPGFLGQIQSDHRLSRLDLANWLVDADKGAGKLTARVLVNRLWYLLFGQGLASDLTDFGGQGQPSDHPELLDNLALRLIEHDWRIKPLIKEILLSRSYRQASSPGKGFDSLQTSHRLSAEAVRDNALSVSGILVRDIGGPSVKPYQPAGYYRHLNFPARKYAHHTDDRQWRRGIYIHWQRQFLHPMMKAFDAPRREECAAQRSRSNTPLSSLVLLNDPTFVKAAQALATRIIKEGGTDTDARIKFAFRLVLSRNPDSLEQTTARKFLVNEPGGETTSWNGFSRVLLNLSETYTRR